MDLIGKEVYVDVGSMRGKWRKKFWKKGKVVRKYNGWYLMEFGEGESKWRLGVSRMDMRMDIKEVLLSGQEGRGK